MESNQPRVNILSRPIFDDQGESTAYLCIFEYDNAIQASLYDKSPRLGSMTLAYPVVDNIERQTIIAGKHEQLSAALGLLLVRRTKKIVYASVNLVEHTSVTNELIKDMIREYIEILENRQ